ncbi:hypothetical protein LINPERHAP1_LOCUS30830 [Linum perenne]
MYLWFSLWAHPPIFNSGDHAVIHYPVSKSLLSHTVGVVLLELVYIIQ